MTSSEEKQRPQVCVRLEPKLFEIIKSKASEAKVTLAEVVRGLIKKGIQG